MVVIENEAETGGFSEASEEASFECVVVGIVWNSNFALHFCPEQRESDRVEAGDAQGKEKIWVLFGFLFISLYLEILLRLFC